MIPATTARYIVVYKHMQQYGNNLQYPRGTVSEVAETLAKQTGIKPNQVSKMFGRIRFLLKNPNSDKKLFAALKPYKLAPVAWLQNEETVVDIESRMLIGREYRISYILRGEIEHDTVPVELVADNMHELRLQILAMLDKDRTRYLNLKQDDKE